MNKLSATGCFVLALAILSQSTVAAERFQFVGCPDCITGQTLKIKGPKGNGSFQFDDDFGFQKQGVSESRMPNVEYFGTRAIVRAAGPNGDRLAVVDFGPKVPSKLLLDLRVVESILGDDLSWGAARLSSENRYLPPKKIAYFDLEGSVEKKVVFERSISATDEKAYARRDSEVEDPERVFGPASIPKNRGFFFIDSVKNKNTLYVVAITKKGPVISKRTISGSFRGGIKSKKWLSDKECEIEDRGGEKFKIDLP